MRSPSYTTQGTVVRLWHNPTGRIGLLLLGIVLLAAVLGPWFVEDPNATDYANQLAGPSAEHLLGTDLAGRDNMARALDGGRYSLGVALGVSVATMAVGLTVGLVAGMGPSWLDRILSRVIDVLLGMPWLVVSLAIVGALGPGLRNLLVALIVIGWAYLARLVRTEVISARQRPDVIAARMAGVSTFRNAVAHVVPGVFMLMLVAVTAAFTEVILALAALSFLGLGAQPPTPEWGRMLADSRGTLSIAPWQIVGPGVGLILSVAGMLLVSDALRDLVDPSRHKRGE